jgi:hypothetical protein
MIRNPKQFRALILNHVDADQSWSVVASEFTGYDSFVRWLESEPLHEDHVSRLHAIEMKWREELDETAKNKKRIAGQ